MKPENPPAFPLFIPENESPRGFNAQGMTLRDYFAAKAPKVPKWFEADKPKTPRNFSSMSKSIKDKYDSEHSEWFDRPTEEERKEVNLWEESWTQYKKLDNEYPAKRFFAWRWYYADQMLKDRS
jgi:hypothetical protein